MSYLRFFSQLDSFTKTSIAAIILILCAIPFVAHNKLSVLEHAAGSVTYYISPTGADSGSCTTSQTACATFSYIQSKGLNPGDTVLYEPGTYDRQVFGQVNGTTDAPITIKADGAVTITRPQNPTTSSQSLALLDLNGTTYVTVDGFTVIGMVGRSDYNNQVQPYGGEVMVEDHNITESQGDVLQNLTVENSANTCIKLEDGESNMIIQNNITTNCGPQASATQPLPSTIIPSQDHCIYVSGPSNTIKNNTCNGTTGYGIHVYGTSHPVDDNQILSNTVTNAKQAGIISAGKNSLIANNKVFNSWWGIDIRNVDDKIINNIVAGSHGNLQGNGLIFYNSFAGNKIYNNTFYNNLGYALYVTSIATTSTNTDPNDIENNIFYKDSTATGGFNYVINGTATHSPAPTTIDYNDFYNINVSNSPIPIGTHSFQIDPLFRTTDNTQPDAFSLQTNSPVIGIGNPQVGTSTDLGAVCALNCLSLVSPSPTISPINTIAPSTTPIPIPGDTNGDGHVDIFDLSELSREWLQTGNNLAADFNHDGKVEVFDLSILSRNLGL